jgi:hypothetical protein
MNIVIKTEQPINSHFSLNDKAIFCIYWEHEGECYPNDSWEDFGYIIIKWWISTIFRLIDKEESEGEFSFMDGPYEILVKLDRASKQISLHPKGTDTNWNLSVFELIGLLEKAIDSIKNKFAGHIKNEELLTLNKYMIILGNCSSRLLQ